MAVDHVLPIRCVDGGFAERRRSWELAVDLVSDAGHPAVAVVCRLVTTVDESVASIRHWKMNRQTSGNRQWVGAWVPVTYL